MAGRTLTVVCRYGLCNRLRVLLSGMALAEETGRSFRMYWPRTPHCHAAFGELFDNAWEVIDGEPDAAARHGMREIGAWERFPDFQASTAPRLAIVSHTWLIHPGLYAHHAVLMDRCRNLLGSLVPKAAIRERAAMFRDAWFRPRMIGVHVRRGDFANIRVRPHVVGGLEASLAAAARHLDETPDAGIFLSTDDGAPHPRTSQPTAHLGVREAFAARFGDRLVPAQSSTLDRGTTLAIQEALVDLLLLRDTDSFVGTTQSSFSDTVVLGRRGPVTLCADPSAGYARQERWARMTGLHALVMAWARRRFDPDVPFHWVWNIWLERELRLLSRQAYVTITRIFPRRS